MQAKDAAGLDKAISECESAEYPELGPHLRKARDVLETLGGGRGDVKSATSLRDRLTELMQAKDAAGLDKAISECESAEYPELGPHLRKARDVLETLGGGRGGTKTPESLRRKLKSAMKQGDKDTLDKVIHECIAAGMPELDVDISVARDVLKDVKISPPTDMKTVESLRDQLEKATKLKDKVALRQIIEDCEAVAYPELSFDLSKARDTLESLGGGRGGHKSVDSLRDKLKEAVEAKDKGYLQKIVQESVSAGMPELDDDILKARSALDILEGGSGDVKSATSLRDRLTELMQAKDAAGLDKAISECESAEYPELGPHLRKARDVLETLGGGRGDMKTVESLRDQLEKATKLKDKVALRQIIEDCEAVAYPELSFDLSKARDTLESLGGGRGGHKSVDSLRDKLKEAVEAKDKGYLQKIVQESVSAGMPELDDDILKARSALDILEGGSGDVKSATSLRDRLTELMQAKDAAGLDKAISECESAEYPELGPHLRKARDVLETLGGGRGGTKTPESLRRKLKSAMKQGDKDTLDKVIHECIAAGMPELDVDISVARDVLKDVKISPPTDMKTVESLRDQLEKATKLKDKVALRQIIEDCEAVAYPELSFDLSKARDTLESLGGGRGGHKSVDSLRDKLKEAVEAKDKGYLQKIVQESVSAGMPELDDDILKARSALDILEGGSGDVKSATSLRDRLTELMQAKDAAGLDKAISECESAEYPELGPHLRKARDVLETLGGGRGDMKTVESLRDQLEKATKLKDKVALRQIIEDCEAVAYPELSFDLSKARDTLESLGGGRGGTKTPESLRRKLKSAMKQGDKDTLDKVIHECIAAGMPELDVDISVARDVLKDVKISPPTDMKTVESLRDQLEKATKLKDKVALRQIIEDCEAVAYPELSFDLSKARDTLESLGGGRGGHKSVDSLRDKLKEAVEAKDKGYLQKIVQESVSAGMPELDDDILKARSALDILEGGSGDVKSATSLRDRLTELMQAKDAAGLDKAISECESAEYPELGPHLRKARDVLETLGGGRGGTKTPESLRRKLKSAMKQGDKDTLDKVIHECIAAGMPELDVDISVARDVLKDVKISPPTDMKTVESLRDQLEKATKLKDKVALRQIIEDCEAVAYPELSFDLSKARDTLESLGGGRGGHKSVDSLRDKLKEAVEAKDKGYLQKIVQESVSAGMPELDDDILKARSALDILEGGSGDVKSATSLRDRLTELMQAKDAAGLDKAISECESAEYPELGPHLRKARDVLETLGGGRGGTKTPESLRRKLKSAMKQGDKDTLDKVIHECIAAGMPELDVDISVARDVLKDVKISPPTDMKTVESLRDQLEKATKLKDKVALRQIIEDCEAVAYPELSFDLSKARDTLESLGGGRGGHKSVDSLRDKLKEAVEAKDKGYLQKIVQESVSAGMPELDDDILKARSALDILEGGSGDVKSATSLRDRLTELMQAKDAAGLDKAISECESAEYPELGPHLRKARDVLETLGGGRGGTKTPESLRRKLKSAMKQGDKDTLDKVIHECIAAGMPELDVDISVARDVLKDVKISPPTDMKTVESLRDQLEKATKLKDKVALRQIIEDCEAVAYPELSFDLSKARDTLESLGGGRGGHKSVDSLRDKLKEAVEAKDKGYLQKIVQESVSAGMPELDDDILKARSALDILEGGSGDVKSATSLRDRLTELMQAKDAAGLDKAISECESAEYPELGPHLRKARDVLETLGGGRGGTKTPESLRRKLKSAMKQGDKDTLDKVIHECIAAGMPELDVDISVARDVLKDVKISPPTDMKTVESLRDELEKSAKLKDQVALSQIIEDCEAVTYPELSCNLSNAKDTLESLGGGLGGHKSVHSLRGKLKEAVEAKDKGYLQKIVQESVSAGMPELDDDILKARSALDILEGGSGDVKSATSLRDRLTELMQAKDAAGLDKAISECESAEYPELGHHLRKARDVLETLGGGRGELQTSESLREQMEMAIKTKDKSALDELIKKCEEFSYPELGPELCKARKSLHKLTGSFGG
ncbi:uncharacterized protein LOC115214251 [Octopus sinensis]|uniref:Uncharacterized protein LOC115214251 n=1 Tax=Octopus sinensis TaxID=2607531 RepID=A0A7E6EZ94_9MOLL|nr:uncharacterized protein LOC115214251 [Octopus sinensis]